MDRGLELTSQAEPTHFWFQGFRGFVAPVLQQLANGRRDLTLIDCGCGTGFNLSLLDPYGQTVGFDLTATGAARARAAGRSVAVADITSIPFASSRFDIAASFDVLQCVDDHDAAMREMARLVKPGGAVVLTVAAFDALRGDHAISWNELRRYTPATVKALVERAGLRVERVRFMFASIFPVVVAARVSQRLLRPWRGVRDDVDIAVPAPPVNAALTALLRVEGVLARRMPMPIGSSLIVVARKP